MTRFPRPVLPLLALALMAGCATPEVSGARIISEGFCMPSAETVGAALGEPVPAPLPGFSARAQRMAVLIGIAPQLSGLIVGDGPPLQRLRMRQMVVERIVAASLDVQEAMALLDCEDERGDQLRSLLEARESRASRRLTIASIGIGAFTAVATGGLSLAAAPTAASAVGIAGGLGEASSGVAQLLGESRGRLMTSRNILREIRERPEQSTMLPAVVWRYLLRHDTEGASVLDQVVEQWRGAGLLGEGGFENPDRRTALLVGEGGVYSTADLNARGAMLDGLEAAIGRMSRSLRLLLAEMQTVLPP
ncbi:hypothetical protein EOD42_24865 [Rhodovarius crocodyli]|uniref:Uncharacterized protein n=1 Tax=Rhodovarius crocodyli TaxID=1979269 RepID=A0A437LW70_9PROT|nr:hypothetical protein [Rhodovarius crocodyli]RVT89632.1 hypothetical protein EOD42_24865 [Rhodovarius crocodyli]